MKSILIALLFIALLSYTSASCLTDTEIATINASAINTNVNPDIMINLYERLCNGNRDAVASDIQSFNNSIQTTVSNLRDQMNDNNNNISNQVNTQVNLAVSSVNQSALSTSIQQIAVLYNQTITYNNITAIREYIDNSIALAKGEIYLKMDNQTTSFMTDYNKFKDDTNAIVVKDNNDALSTNRIILLIAGCLVFIGGFWYFFIHKKVNPSSNIRSAPYVLRQGGLSDEEFAGSHQIKGMPTRKIK